MESKKPILLLCTNGDLHTRPALEYGVWLAEAIKAEVELLGVSESSDEAGIVKALLEETASRLDLLGISHKTILDSGQGPETIARYAGPQHLTVVGPLGRTTWRRMVHGRSIRQIMEKVPIPILYIRQAHLKLERILLCMGGLGYTASMELVALYLAQATQARITILHVVEPVNLEYKTAREVQANWQNILETDTPQGQNLSLALAIAQGTGLKVEFKVSRGNIVHQILEEARQGSYDLIGMGSPYSAHSLRHLYMPNVTAEVAEALECPILTARQGGGVFDS
jgi:nucleotide-binding universal stress UspA family protein